MSQAVKTLKMEYQAEDAVVLSHGSQNSSPGRSLQNPAVWGIHAADQWDTFFPGLQV